MARVMARTLGCPHLYKKKAVFSASNYRGVHLTAQLSKVAERLLLPMLETHISHTVACGPNQFAHTKGRGARDALAYLMMSWILALIRRKKVAVYCSDVSGAFDRVRAERLLEKLRCKGVHPAFVDLAGSRLQQRSAQVVVEGQRSDKMLLRNVVFQGTVPGPTLWNLFYEDARRAIHEAGFVEIVYADDLNGFRSSNTMSASTPSCQRPRGVKPSCTSGVKRTRSRSIQRRNPSTSCPTPNHTATRLKLLGGSSGWSCACGRRYARPLGS